MSKPSVSVNIGGLKLKNPVMTASGTFGYGLEFAEYVDLSKLGAIVVKGLALKPVMGNPPQRIVETASGMLNAIGLQNIGVESFLAEKLPKLLKYKTPVIANIYGTSAEDYAAVAGALDGSGTAGVEINISCPNVKKGGMQFAADAKIVSGIIKGVKRRFRGVVIVKLSPNTGNIEDMACACESAGADSVSVINTLVGLAVDLEKRRPVLANIYGGLSGPAIKPVALAMVHKVSRRVKIPVIGIGGIMNANDALEFIVAGATAVQVGTANFRDPSASQKTTEGIRDFLKEKKIRDLKCLIGSLKY